MKSSESRNALLAIGVGGFLAGTLSLLLACFQSGWEIILAIAGGLIGDKADHGGAAIYLLGIFLHFFISFTVAAVYYAASRRLPFLMQHTLISGLYFGATVRVVMIFIVLPLSALHATDPIPLKDFWWGVIKEIIFVGLPIAYSVRSFAKPEPVNRQLNKEIA